MPRMSVVSCPVSHPEPYRHLPPVLDVSRGTDTGPVLSLEVVTVTRRVKGFSFLFGINLH